MILPEMILTLKSGRYYSAYIIFDCISKTILFKVLIGLKM
jgi:hypothetical protein